MNEEFLQVLSLAGSVDLLLILRVIIICLLQRECPGDEEITSRKKPATEFMRTVHVFCVRLQYNFFALGTLFKMLTHVAVELI